MLVAIIEFIIIIIGLIIVSVIHELGHLLGGLLSKYEFRLFYASLICFYKMDEKIKFKFRKVTLSNLFSGQCVMIPSQDFHRFNPFWINISGSLFNILIAIILLLVRANVGLNPFSMLPWLIQSQMILNFVTGLINLIPLRMLGQQSDGYNIIRGFYSTDRRSMYILMTTNNQLKKGKRYRDFDSDLLTVDPSERMNRFYIAYLIMMHAFHLMDKGEHEKAVKEFNRIDLKFLPYEWQFEVKSEILYHCLIYNFDTQKSEELYEDGGLKRFLQKNEVLPKRVLAAYTLIILGDIDKGQQLLHEAIALAQLLEGGYREMELDRIQDFTRYKSTI